MYIKGYCTPILKLACFVMCYIKINTTFFYQNNMYMHKIKQCYTACLFLSPNLPTPPFARPCLLKYVRLASAITHHRAPI